ncbi:Pimeloyl-ACP methyl ester carboxylesterase (modular protein) [Frankia canadensis]|uniref:Pimeloyl-ACP methyl ester carboxylesterase (Modular protein) n=2 Tax=Frankia canadensis TaxID=1836972 RepID=A0A2I2KNQ3_9ACTN|nr:alpha/beta fold hydrolase [Frankia canadensis]SNQ47305.1 Pimeloyl-ACP methyl ester carboxylesterase (modular protein) [Frankia canadensis]SOU54595.1 Pimeloyl-ACP methyl ester carboxylesterase (modular protein) [Frankia canadensis]
MTVAPVPQVEHRFVDVAGVQVFYRATGPANAPTMMLLHGFPSASHQFRRLMDALGTGYRLIAPDYPGFGHTEAPDGFTYSFEALADIIEGFVRKLGLRRFVLYAFDFGGPVGFRLATRHPDWIAGLVIQNANAYDEGLSPIARELIANRPGVDGAEERVRAILTLPVTRSQYDGGVTDPALIAPDGWTLDQHFLDRPGRKDAQVDLTLDYHSNVTRYPTWQTYLRTHQPPSLVVWGRNDAFFTEAGAHAYRRDLPDAELHLFDTGHFALEEKLPEIAPLIAGFLDRVWPVAPMKIAVIGATGQLGRVVAAEATARGHHVTPLHRDAVDVTDPVSVTAAVSGHDAVVVAVKGPDRLVPRGAQALLDALPAAGVDRLVFLGGGGSLEYAPGLRFVDGPDFPAQYVQTARDQAEALDILRAASTAVRWSYVSPPPIHLVPGDRTGTYRTAAGDTPIVDASGDSRVTTGDYASAVLDALESGSFVQQRFTVGY